jgi:anti-sigma factor RsiW
MVEPKNWSSELTAYIDGELSGDDADALERALRADPALSAQEQRLRRAVAAIEALPEPAASPSAARLRAQVLAAVTLAGPELRTSAWQQRLARWFSGPRLAGLAVAAAATVVVLAPRREGEELAATRPAGVAHG